MLISGKDVYTVELPMYINIPRAKKKDKKIPLTMNWYRNAHHHESSEVKKRFKPITADLWDKKPRHISVGYFVAKKSKARYDTMNLVSVVDKFFMDWLVNNGYIDDDDCDTVSYSGAVGKKGLHSNFCIAKIEVSY